MKSFSSETELILFLAKHFREDIFYKKLYNSYFENLNMNGKDKINYGQAYVPYREDYHIRSYLFIDSDNRIIDIRDYYDIAVQKYEELKNKRISREKPQPEYGERLYLYGNRSFRYRIDPVPYISNKKRYGRYLRRVKTTQELRNNEHCEYKKFVRGKRKNLPTYYDDILIKYQRSWKKHSKQRKQWM